MKEEFFEITCKALKNHKVGWDSMWSYFFMRLPKLSPEPFIPNLTGCRIPNISCYHEFNHMLVFNKSVLRGMVGRKLLFLTLVLVSSFGIFRSWVIVSLYLHSETHLLLISQNCHTGTEGSELPTKKQVILVKFKDKKKKKKSSRILSRNKYWPSSP